jgi:hypothetical protein
LADWDPNNELNATVVRQWLSFSDFYHWPHVILFDSWEDLAQKLDAADFHVRLAQSLTRRTRTHCQVGLRLTRACSLFGLNRR